jgi:hypothetical protein
VLLARTGYAPLVIVVVGHPLARMAEGGPTADGFPARIALAAAAAGRTVQLVGKTGEDPEGDAVVLALAAGGVGHVALLRDAGRPTLRALATDDLPLVETGSDLDRPARNGLPAEPVADASLDAADVDLALRYLTEYAVVVLADPANADVLRVVADASSWVGARLILVVPAGQPIPEHLPSDVIAFEAPDGDPDGAFATFVGMFAAALDEGDDPADAFRASIAAEGWSAAPG